MVLGRYDRTGDKVMRVFSAAEAEAEPVPRPKSSTALGRRGEVDFGYVTMAVPNRHITRAFAYGYVTKEKFAGEADMFLIYRRIEQGSQRSPDTLPYDKISLTSCPR